VNNVLVMELMTQLDEVIMIFGIDAGSKFIKISTSDKDDYLYGEHHGNPENIIGTLISDRKISENDNLIICGHYAGLLKNKHPKSYIIDETTAIVQFIKEKKIESRHIVNIGAQSIKYIQLDSNYDFKLYRENTLCAAGTGSFLDEQMNRMGITYDSLKDIGFVQTPPHIATRCAVFAKSDLIHRQQEGYSIEEMWNGLCRGVVVTMLHSVFKGNIPKEKIIFCGGIFKNNIIRKWVETQIENACFPDNCEFPASIGCAAYNISFERNSDAVSLPTHNSDVHFVLQINKSNLYSSNPMREYNNNGSEVRIHCEIPDDSAVSIGIDIGSTSTKAVVIETKSKNVLLDIYRKTAGNPIHATAELFSEISKIFSGKNFSVVSAGTTGSGRKLIGKIIGADIIVNEITAHFKGASHFDNTIETIFEIGGQDSKYIRAKDGSVVDSNMNYVCAAGTGSFIEEQAARLGFHVREIGDRTIGLSTPHTSDRCTVFMEQDINKLLRDGYSREEALAGVMRSIVKNYLNRVVGSRPITGDKIFFQGATARNKGLVAAFEQITGKEIVVSPYCHVMGAYGAAIISLDAVRDHAKFRGMSIFEKAIKLEYTVCQKCINKCKVSIAEFSDGSQEMWGFMCGKDSLEEKRKFKSMDYFHSIDKIMKKNVNTEILKKAKTIGIPKCLSMFTYMPMWAEFFKQLGFNVIISEDSTAADKDLGVTVARADFCFPVKVALAQSYNLVKNSDIDAVFYPTVISEKKQKNDKPRIFCPYVISYPSIIKNELAGGKPVITPSIDFRFTNEQMVESLYESLSEYGLSKDSINKAYSAAGKELQRFYKERYELGKKILKKIEDENKTGVVIIGRPYNLYDKIINLNLPEHIAENDKLIVFPFECLLDPEDNDSELLHVYWNYGEKILYASEKIKHLKNIFPVYFTNFGCGPDSFILTRFENIMQGKPYLIIELDEHGSDTGYITRIEAFLDVVFDKNKRNQSPKHIDERYFSVWKYKERKLWVPAMHEWSGRLMAACFRGWGYNAEAIDDENIASYEIGKQNVRGSECLPASTTIGAFIKKMKEINADPKKHALLMPTADGPCRFGQYMVLHRNILDANGLGDIEIFSPTSTNSYLGMPNDLRMFIWESIIAGDLLLKAVCRKRPYEVDKGTVDGITELILKQMESDLENKIKPLNTLIEGLAAIDKVSVKNEKRPLVGIVGEIYVRNNKFCNDNLVRYIENNGGEAWLSPSSEWFIYTSWMEKYFAKLYGKNIFQRKWIDLQTRIIFNILHKYEKKAEKYLPGRMEPPVEKVIDAGKKHLPLIFEGEAILTVGRTIEFFEQGAEIVVNCAPFGCMPGNITASIMSNIPEITKPVLTLFYDGESDMNRIVGIYLNNLK